MSEYEIEPIRGLPGHLPPGERILWQGGPDRTALARRAFHARAVAIYFGALIALAAGFALLRDGSWTGTIATVVCGILALAVLNVLAWASARSSVYTLTDRRVVLRVGVALPKCINLPLSLVNAVDLATHGDGTADIALRLTGKQQLGWLPLWPHARPWRLATPEPMLRAVRDGAEVAGLLARACGVLAPVRAAPTPVVAAPAFAEQVAA